MYYFLAKRLAAAALVDVAREVAGDAMADTVDSAEGADVDMDECCAYLRARRNVVRRTTGKLVLALTGRS